MTQYRVIRNASTNEVVLPHAEWRGGFLGQAIGLMFRLRLGDGEGLIFAYGAESVPLTSITMLFMFFSIATIWLDKNGVVVDKVLAKPWRLSYIPRHPAQYFIEARPALLDRVAIGDRLRFDEVASKR